eukprot:Trichotokara_eunicae@DN1896_c0_g1_i1.p1
MGMGKTPSSSSPSGSKTPRPTKSAGGGSSSKEKSDRTPAKKDKKKIPRGESYTVYISRVLKQVHPSTAISKRAMMIMNSFITDTFEKVAQESARLCQYARKDTLSAREIHAAVRLVLPGDLAKHAVLEGTKAVTRFTGKSSTL